MSLTLVGPNNKQRAILEQGTLLIIQNGSWELYWALANEDLKIEYIKEQIFIQSPASLTHEEIFRFLFVKISNYLEKKDLGKILGSRFPIKLADGRRVEPDLLFLSKKSIQAGKLTETVFEGIPTWIIEIISPSYREHDTITKRKEYALLNVEEYWIIDPEYKTVELINFKANREVRKETKDSGAISPRITDFNDFQVFIEDIFAFQKNL